MFSMTSFPNETFDSLKEFSRIIKYRDFEYEKFELAKKDFDEKDYSFIINTQMRLNLYVKDFLKQFLPKTRTAVEEQMLGDLQGKYMQRILSEVPTEDADKQELFSNKILETFALHNRSLAQTWENLDQEDIS